ncbi:MAG: ribosome small subunit-dependent GTPase A [Candidatus Cloacimonetes bacterium]|nr:ribosome small subunit-dependent GTPase A [Candidatus Cloacimonadota bacterium]
MADKSDGRASQRDKKKFSRRNIRLRNLELDDIDMLDEEDIAEDRRAEKKLADKGRTSDKSDLKLHRGRILEVYANHICLVHVDGEALEATLGGRLRNLKLDTRTLAAAGDWVQVDLADKPRIEEIEERRNSLVRFSEHSFQTRAILAANIDQVLITVAWRQPPFNGGLVDRYICAAGIENIEPVLCVNKIDLAENIEEVRNACRWYEQAGLQVIYVSAESGMNIELLPELLRDRETVFSGVSGVGKTSLINLVQPGWRGRVSEVSESTSKGRHTTTRSRLIPWKFGGYLVDTPGIKTFGLHRRHFELLPKVFPGFAELGHGCRFRDCTHTHEIDCAIRDALQTGSLPQERYTSYLRLRESLA